MLNSLRQLFLFLTIRQRWAFFALFISMLIAAALEVAALGAVPTCIQALTSSSPDDGIALPAWVLKLLGLDSITNVAVAAGLLLFGAYLVKILPPLQWQCFAFFSSNGPSGT